MSKKSKKETVEEESSSGIKILAKNRRAFYEYTVEDRFESGIMLVGTEVKSIKNGKFSFSDSYADIRNNEVWLHGLHITPYKHGTHENHDPDRERKLLLHAQEIKRLKRKTEERGYTLVPLSFYLKKSIVKVELGLCRGKKLHDKRASIKDRDQKRDAQRELKNFNVR
ncbi:MAG: SsrA-binding protein SmpB [Spirochaetales bacterium]|nr:SsrA-binding protein SmpB [Spirochaetales bacterium]